MTLPESNFRKKYKNELWDSVMAFEMERDLPPIPISDFELVGPHAEGKGWIGKIRHLPSNSEFQFRFTASFDPAMPFFVSYSPHDTLLRFQGMVTGWNSVVTHFSQWLRAVAEELLPDRWEEERIRAILARTFASDYDSDFTAPEVAQIGESFRAATLEIQERGLLSGSDLASLTEVLHEQHQAAPATPRIQWQTIAATAIITRLIERGIDAVKMQSVMAVIANALSWINAHIGASLEEAVKLLTKGQ